MAQDIKQKLRNLHAVDNRLSYLWNKIALTQVDMLSQTPLFGPWYKDCLFTTGSQIEGGFYARMFLHGKHINEGDYMFSIGNIPDPTTQLQPIEHLPGYFSVRFDGILDCLHAGVREKFLENFNTEQRSDFLARSSVLIMTQNMFSSTPTKSRMYEVVGNTIFQPNVPCKATDSFELKGPSVVTNVVLTCGQKHLAEVLVDTVPCFELSSWPDEWGFQMFLTRNRKWPTDLETIEKVWGMVYIVPKSSPKLTAESERENCWRLSFSKAETLLKSLFTEDESRVYLFFKILFYANIKKIEKEGKTMPSYFCKTAMLWAMEEEGEKLCKNDLFEAIRRLFRKLKQFLDSNHGLPNFFCPSINLLEGYPKELITECSTMAENITQRPLNYLPSNFDDVCEHLEKVVRRIDKIQLENFVETLSEYVNERRYLKDCTAFELYWQSMHPLTWRVRFLFHPFVRAVIRNWVRRQCVPVGVIMFSACFLLGVVSAMRLGDLGQ